MHNKAPEYDVHVNLSFVSLLIGLDVLSLVVVIFSLSAFSSRKKQNPMKILS
jgi:hypothetical protein